MTVRYIYVFLINIYLILVEILLFNVFQLGTKTSMNLCTYNRLFSRFCVYVRYANKNSDRIDNVLLLRK